MEVSGEDNGEVGDEEDNQSVRISEADDMSRAFTSFCSLKRKLIRTVLKHLDLKQAGKRMRLSPNNSSCISVFHIRRIRTLWRQFRRTQKQSDASVGCEENCNKTKFIQSLYLIRLKKLH